jgi:hypothetical protein
MSSPILWDGATSATVSPGRDRRASDPPRARRHLFGLASVPWSRLNERDNASHHPSTLVPRQRRSATRRGLDSPFEASTKATSLRRTNTPRIIFRSRCQINVDPLHENASNRLSKLLPNQRRSAARRRFDPSFKANTKAMPLRRMPTPRTAPQIRCQSNAFTEQDREVCAKAQRGRKMSAAVNFCSVEEP